jgi:hypothetical protein
VYAVGSKKDTLMAKRKRGNSEGSIYKMQDGRWRAAVTTSKDANGKPKRKASGDTQNRPMRDT